MIYCPMCESSEVELEHGRCAVCASAVIDITDIVQAAEKRGRDAALVEVRQKAIEYSDYCWEKCKATTGEESMRWAATANGVNAVIRAIDELGRVQS